MIGNKTKKGTALAMTRRGKIILIKYIEYKGIV